MNFSLSSALECAAAALLAASLGCSRGDGAKELEQGREAYGLRDLARADKFFTRSLALSPDDVDRLTWLARVKLELGEINEAKTLTDKAQALSDGDVDVMLLAAQTAFHAKDYKTAAKIFTAIGEDASLGTELRSQGLAGLGVVEMACENHHLARISFLRAIRLNRRNAAAWYHLGFLYRDAFEYLEASLEQFEIFIRLDTEAGPRVQKVQRTVIPALKEAISRNAAERPGVARRDSSASASAIAMAEAALKKNQIKAARGAYQEALRLDPLSYPAAFGLARAWERSDSSKAGQMKAFENYRLACELRPSAISTFLATGAMAARLGLHSQAVEIYSRAVAASPSSLDALDGLIRALRRVGGKANIAKAYQSYRDSMPVKKK
ncbi:MAG: tetratricopeptide repeat protein [Kiritimatiellae bacterium]|nr:tetratricopeptide repeat protein [Kiritimatiellia bacterium]